jgi:hypothetical protein
MDDGVSLSVSVDPSIGCLCLLAYSAFLCWNVDHFYVRVECFCDCILSVLCVCMLILNVSVYPHTECFSSQNALFLSLSHSFVTCFCVCRVECLRYVCPSVRRCVYLRIYVVLFLSRYFPSLSTNPYMVLCARSYVRAPGSCCICI